MKRSEVEKLQNELAYLENDFMILSVNKNNLLLKLDAMNKRIARNLQAIERKKKEIEDAKR